MGATFMKLGRAPTMWRTFFIVRLKVGTPRAGQGPPARWTQRSIHQETTVGKRGAADVRGADEPTPQARGRHSRALRLQPVAGQTAREDWWKADDPARVGPLPGERRLLARAGGHRR